MQYKALLKLKWTKKAAHNNANNNNTIASHFLPLKIYVKVKICCSKYSSFKKVAFFLFYLVNVAEQCTHLSTPPQNPCGVKCSSRKRHRKTKKEKKKNQ